MKPKEFPTPRKSKGGHNTGDPRDGGLKRGRRGSLQVQKEKKPNELILYFKQNGGMDKIRLHFIEE